MITETSPATSTDLDRFFHPRLTAVVGATDNKQHPNYFMFKKVADRAELEGGTIYAVNPRATLTEIDGYSCVPTIADVPGDIDLVVLMVNKDRIEQSLRDIVARKPKFVIIFTAGFRETGIPEDAALEERLGEIARGSGVRLFGPNTNVNALEIFPELRGPKFALVTQSGHQGRPIAQAVDLGIGVKAWVPTGNEADLEAADFIEYFAGQDDVACICAYIEGFKSIDNLRLAAVRAAERRVPIVLVKIGRTEEGRRMAQSHTGHLTGSDAVHDAFFRQHGMIRVDDLDEIIDMAALFTRSKRPAADGICIYAISGGTGTHLADLAAGQGLRLPRLEEKTQRELHELGIADYLTVANPIDNGANPIRKPGVNRKLIEACLADPNVDILVCPITGILESMSTTVAEDIVWTYRNSEKPVIVIWGSPIIDDPGYRLLVEGRVPMFRSFTNCVAGLRRWLDYWRFVDGFEPPRADGAGVPGELEEILSGSGTLSEHAAALVAAHYGVPFPRSTLCDTEDEAIEAASRAGTHVVMKACGPGILHKSDLGLVRVGVAQDDVATTFKELAEAGRAHAGERGFEGVLVQEMAPEGEEVLVGINDDPQFGPVVLFGLGGIFVEVLKDVAMRPAPLTRSDAEQMVREVRGRPLLEGVRGRPAADVDALVRLLLDVSRMASELRTRVAELDLNPVRVLPSGQGVVALDALIVRKGAP